MSDILMAPLLYYRDSENAS